MSPAELSELTVFVHRRMQEGARHRSWLKHAAIMSKTKEAIAESRAVLARADDILAWR
jgi:hypothetical protein